MTQALTHSGDLPDRFATGTDAASREPILETRGLSVSYGATSALADVSLRIRRGRITAVIGPSGCGKSSFLASLNRLTDLVPDCRVTGRIFLDGRDTLTETGDLIALRRRVGMIFQQPNPFPLSIARNLDLPLKELGVRHRDERRARSERALRQVGLWDEVAGRLQASALSLSGGQQQRLCLARAIALEPEVLLMDEPCSALDPIASATVEDLIQRLSGRYTMVVVTHNLAQAQRIADDTAVFWLRDGAGRMIETGPTRQIFEAPRDEQTAAYVTGRCC